MHIFRIYAHLWHFFMQYAKIHIKTGGEKQSHCGLRFEGHEHYTTGKKCNFMSSSLFCREVLHSKQHSCTCLLVDRFNQLNNRWWLLVCEDHSPSEHWGVRTWTHNRLQCATGLFMDCSVLDLQHINHNVCDSRPHSYNMLAKFASQNSQKQQHHFNNRSNIAVNQSFSLSVWAVVHDGNRALLPRPC